MRYILTDHAQKRIAMRRISIEWLEDTLNFPAKIEVDHQDLTLIHVLRPIPERGFQVLRVIYNETVEPIRIVTAYFDDEVKNL